MERSCLFLQLYGKKACVTLLESEGKQRAQRGSAAHCDVAIPRHASAWCYWQDGVSLSTGRVEMLQSCLSKTLKMC